MTSDSGNAGRRFIASTLMVTGVLAAAFAAFNWRINFYGAFGDTRGQNHTVTFNERQTKYLYSFNYIPQSFDSILLGSSVAGNIDTSKVTGLRMYNTAVSGGNITEEKLIVENALERGNLKLIVVCINPYLLETHGRKSGGMRPRDAWGAYGSVDLVRSYFAGLAIRLGLEQPRFAFDGVQQLEGIIAPVAPGAAKVTPVAHFELDPVAVAEIEELTRLARAHGAAMAWMFPPVFQPTYDLRREAYREFEERIEALAQPGELILRFNDGSFSALTAQPATFVDGVHMTGSAAIEVARILDQRIRDAGSRTATLVE